ncbi:MAG TPA: DUF4105 domain-containing protein [Verrucomicrobiae bacterium]|nr:DUF4105 domain-containing protein [Verrucomicrobiae bacterium]
MTPAPSNEPAPNKAPRSKRWLQTLLFIGLCLLLLVATLWAALALYIDVRIAWLRAPLAAIHVLALLGVWIFVKGRWRKLALTFGAFIIVLGWWLTLKPSNNRDWQPDLAVLPYADMNGNSITIHNIRNCDYRTETDFDVRHYDKAFDLDKLQSADLYMVYWGSPLMAHTMITFNFAGGDNVCFSIETRKKEGDSYSAIKGLFRQFELTYVIADERDLVRLRTNYRQGEEVYLYRLQAPRERVRQLFLDYVHRANRLREQPEWYNAVSDNCTTAIRTQRASTDRAPWDWRILVNGLGNELLYERGHIVTNVPLAELKERGHVNARAKAADQEENFSRLIRVGVPGVNEPP